MIRFLIYTKITVAAIASAIAFIAFVVPLLATYKPLKEGGYKSSILKYRLFSRFFVFMILLHQFLFPLAAIMNPQNGHGNVDSILSFSIVPIFILLMWSTIKTWREHPSGIAGL